MRKLLRRFLDWLDSRFPAKVVVTEQAYKEIGEELARIGCSLNAYNGTNNLLRLRIDTLEASVAAIKDLLAKGGASFVKPEAEKLRDAFVRGDFQRGPVREVVESAAE